MESTTTGAVGRESSRPIPGGGRQPLLSLANMPRGSADPEIPFLLKAVSFNLNVEAPIIKSIFLNAPCGQLLCICGSNRNHGPSVRGLC